jgi:pyruvate kinase
VQKGPEIRTGQTKDDADIPIKAGAEINITTDDKYLGISDDKNMYEHSVEPLDWDSY